MKSPVVDSGMPANQEAERAILGAILLDNLTYHQAASGLQADDFFLDSHRRIFLRASELAQSGRPIDFVTLTEQLGQHKEIEAVGGVAYVTSLTDGLPRVKNIEQYVRIVKDKALLRNLIHAADSGMQQAYEQQDSAKNIIAGVLDNLLTLQSGSTEAPAKISEFSDDAHRNLVTVWDHPEKLRRYSLPLANRITGGHLAEEYCVLMGRTGDGKTGYVIQTAVENGLAGRPVLIFPLELSRDVMYMRMLCHVSKVSNRVLIKHSEEPLDSERAKVLVAKRSLDEAPIFIDDSAELNISQLVAKARQWKRRHCQHEQDGLVVVDYLQKIKSRLREMKERIDQASEGLRLLAKEERLRVLAVSSMGRPEGKNMNARPTKFDPKESGSIENDAHILMSVFRPVDDMKMPTGTDELIVVKNRDGESGIEAVEYRGEIYTFRPRQSV